MTEDHLELAMALYTDHELLRLVLQRAKIPAGAERVAVSLDSVHDGPFVVLTRGGAFVTCLGKHMKAHGLPVIRRSELEAAARDIDRMRERLDRVRQLERESEEESTLESFRRLAFTNTSMPREDFVELVRWDALIGEDLHRHLFECAALSQKVLPELAWLRPDRRRTSLDDRLLETWWNLFWQISNLHVVANVGEVHARCTQFERNASQPPQLPAAAASSNVMTWGIPLVQTTARAIWSSMRHIDVTLDVAEKAARDQACTRIIRDTTLTAVAIGSACGRRRALQILACRAGDADAVDAPMTPHLRHAMRDPELAIDELTLHAQELIAAELGGDPRDVPPDVARARLVTGQDDWLSDPSALERLARAVPWLAVADASELFVPRAWVSSVSFTPERAFSLVRSLARVQGLGRPAPVKRDATPERNERCHCGSGQKYKRCCMRTSMPMAA